MSIVEGYIKTNEEALGLLVQDNAELGAALFECLAALSVVEKESGTSFTDDEEKAVLNRIADLERQAQAMVQTDPIDVANEIAEIGKAIGEKAQEIQYYIIQVDGANEWESIEVEYTVDADNAAQARDKVYRLFEKDYPNMRLAGWRVKSVFMSEVQPTKSAPETKSTKQPETALEWLELLPEPIRTLAITYATSPKTARYPNNRVSRLREAIMDAFQWGETVEGFDYWNKIDNLLIWGTDPKDLPLPDAALKPTASKKPETALEWLEELPEPIRTLAISYAQSPESSLTPNLKVNSLSDAVFNAFNWTTTDEGYSYWKRVRDLLKDGTDPKDLPLPDAAPKATPSKKIKTVLEWLGELPEPIKTLAIRYANDVHSSIAPNDKTETLSQAIYIAFSWRNTIEGDSYWRNVSDLLSGGTDPKDLPLPPTLPVPTADPAPVAPSLFQTQPPPVKRGKQQQTTTNTDIVTAEDLEQLDKLSLDENVEISDDDLNIDDDFLDDLDLDDI